MIDAVLDWHMAPHTCGVSKFNHKLATQLGVPFQSLWFPSTYPLVSIKTEEVHDGGRYQWHDLLPFGAYDLFLHDLPTTGREFLQNPKRVYAANRVIAAGLRPFRPDVIEAWCPSTIQGNASRGAINVLTFGMSSKLDQQMGRYEKLKKLLDATGQDYTVCVSTAVHEGSPWDDTARVGDRLRGVFHDRLRVLGYLADDGLAAELERATAVAVFFDPALRANNTTFWSAMDAGVPILTNFDADSPQHVHALAVDIADVREWPSHLTGIWRSERGMAQSEAYSWDRLLALMQEQPCAKSV